MAAWNFYVYEILNADGSVAYVGKGSGRRLKAQQRNFGLSGQEVARFKREDDAYKFERERIALSAPALNRHPGGNGSRAVSAKTGRTRYLSEIERIGTRKYAVMLLERFAPHLLRTGHYNAVR